MWVLCDINMSTTDVDLNEILFCGPTLSTLSALTIIIAITTQTLVNISQSGAFSLADIRRNTALWLIVFTVLLHQLFYVINTALKASNCSLYGKHGENLSQSLMHRKNRLTIKELSYCFMTEDCVLDLGLGVIHSATYFSLLFCLTGK